MAHTPQQPDDPQTEREVLEHFDTFRTALELTEWFAGTRELQEILNATAERVTKAMNMKACAIRVLDEETGELVITAVYNLSNPYLDKGRVMLSENPIDRATMAGQTVYIADAAADPRTRFPQEAKEEGLVSGLCVPMTYRGTTVGVLRIYAGEVYRFSPYEETLLRNVASQAAAAIIESRLIKEQRETETYLRQMRYAGEIQRRMIPHRPPAHPTVTFGCVYDPSLDVGGDFYDFIVLPDGSVGLTIADVVGKGIPGALMMASVRSALRAYAVGRSTGTGQKRDEGVAAIMSRVNRHMGRDTLSSEFATLFYGVFSATGGTLSYVNAGHDPPLLLRDGRFRELDVGGMVIGVRADASFDSETIELHSRDVLLFYTDGVIDAVNFHGERFGRDRLRKSILKHCQAEPDTMAEQLKWDTRRFAGLAPQTDDITIVVARVS